MSKRGWLRVLLFGVSLLYCSKMESAEIKVESRISKVTVYPASALINRTASLKLKRGEYEIVFADIVPEVDENSLRVYASGEAEVKLFGAQLRKEYLEEVPAEKIKRLQEEIQNLEDEVKATENFKKLLLEEKNFLDSIRLFSHHQIPQDLVTKMPSPEDLEKILKFLDAKLKENYSRLMEAEFSIREKKKKIDVLKRQLNQIRGPVRKLKRSIVVELQVLKGGNLDLSVSYMVRGASWRPIYDARASFEKNEVELVFYGIVKQTTGEDWEDVEIILSTAKPVIGGRMPYVSPWFLRPYQPIARIKGLKMEAPMYQRRAFEEEIRPGEGRRPEVEYARVEEKGIAVVYKLARKATVKSDGSEHKLPVSSQILKAKFEYSTYPRLSPFAYLGTRVTNSSKLQLLAGRVNIFLEGDFVGSSSIDNIAPGEEFDLYLGVDENVKVKRECLEKRVDETLIAGIPSRTKRITLKYKVSVENYKSKTINVRLFEAMPVSQDERIKVKIKDVSLQPDEKDWKDRKGVWLWKLKLEPKAKQEIFYTLLIEHPRDMQVEGL
ncbi:mucoidy inhibitor MuiA family protein [Candidatus Calescamantes bacterium]|nr:mucoidy inhibitor MuiA family protein [Candidatus Calescamantes bacterium]